MYIRLKEDEKLDNKNPFKFEFDLVTKQQDNNWQFGNWGVLGLAPRGQFMTYLTKTYNGNQDLNIALKYNLSDENADNDSLRFKIQPYVNPNKEKHWKDEDVIGRFEIPPQDNFWSISGSVQLEGTEFGYTNQKMCMTSMVNELFGVIDSLVWCNAVKKMVCNGDIKHCTKSKADLKKAPKVQMMLEGKLIEFESDDYIYFVDDDLNCRIGDICDPRSEEHCDDNTEVVLGKLFFEKYTPLLSVELGTGKTSVTLIKDFKAPKEHVFIWLWIAIIVVIIAAAALAFIIIREKRENKEVADDEYQKVDGEDIKENDSQD